MTAAGVVIGCKRLCNGVTVDVFALVLSRLSWLQPAAAFCTAGHHHHHHHHHPIKP
jgi:hypothetical protein